MGISFQFHACVLLGFANLVLGAALTTTVDNISILTAKQVKAYRPYTNYASAAYCSPDKVKSWTCAKCQANPKFKLIDSGGDGNRIQYWYVGYDPTLESVVVAYQGTDPSKPSALATDLDFFPEELDPKMYPKLNSAIRVHRGFAAAYTRSAAPVLAAVKKGLKDYKIKQVTLVGHSLGGALATLGTLHLDLALPKSVAFRTVTYGAPQVGNEAFAKAVNKRSNMNHINNKQDVVPILPGRFLGFTQTEGEIHINNQGQWVSCPGQNNDNPQCTAANVKNVTDGKIKDHSGPYDGIMMPCNS